jgi:hypothetical protein
MNHALEASSNTTTGRRPRLNRSGDGLCVVSETIGFVSIPKQMRATREYSADDSHFDGTGEM